MCIPVLTSRPDCLSHQIIFVIYNLLLQWGELTHRGILLILLWATESFITFFHFLAQLPEHRQCLSIRPRVPRFVWSSKYYLTQSYHLLVHKGLNCCSFYCSKSEMWLSLMRLLGLPVRSIIKDTSAAELIKQLVL